MADCRAEMMKSCQAMPGARGCPMGAGMMGPGSGMGKRNHAGMGAAPVAPNTPAGN
jgi:hypothetical protein